MKSILIASTALIAVASVAQAAEPLKASVRGYMFAGVGYRDNGLPKGAGGQEDIGIMRDGEIHFRVSGSSDNGLTFGARVELEAFTSGDQIDENYVDIGGSWGRVRIGGEDPAANNLATGILYAPGAKIGHYDDFAESGFIGTHNAFGDDIGIWYRTPNFNGLIAEVSYQPNSGSDGGGDGNVLSLGAQDQISAGLNYRYEGDAYALQGSLGYSHADRAAGGDFDQWAAGLQGEYRGLIVGGFWQRMDRAGSRNDYVLNAAYAFDQWTVGGGWAFVENAGGDNNKFAGWVTYALTPGVTAAMIYMGLSF